MIILMPQKLFDKKIEKLVIYKDFLIVDATNRADGSMKQYGNCLSGDEMAPGPVLTMIAQKPDSEEARIKRRRIEAYLQTWYGDEGLNLKLHFILESIVKHWDEHEDDLNVFVVMRNKLFYAYYAGLEEYINAESTVPVCTHILPKMDKKEMKEIAKKEFPPSFYKALRKTCKRMKKSLKIDEKRDESLIIDDMDAL